MYGAIWADIISFKREIRNSQIFYLSNVQKLPFNFTDHTIATVAIADALLPLADKNESEIKTEIKNALNDWHNKYFHGDYKGSENSAAAAISAIPYIYTDSNQVKEIAQMAASVIYDDIQSINNAVLAALAIY